MREPLPRISPDLLERDEDKPFGSQDVSISAVGDQISAYAKLAIVHLYENTLLRSKLTNDHNNF